MLVVAWSAAVAAYAVFAIAQDRWGDVDWLTAVLWLLSATVGWRRQQGPARAIALNSGPPRAG